LRTHIESRFCNSHVVILLDQTSSSSSRYQPGGSSGSVPASSGYGASTGSVPASSGYGASTYNPSGSSNSSGGGYGSGGVKPAGSRFGRLAQFGMSGGSVPEEGTGGSTGGTGEFFFCTYEK
jgi:hypothetical protein